MSQSHENCFLPWMVSEPFLLFFLASLGNNGCKFEPEVCFISWFMRPVSCQIRRAVTVGGVGRRRWAQARRTLGSWHPGRGVWTVMQPDTATSQTRRNTSWFIYDSLRWLLNSKIWSNDCKLENSLQYSLWSVGNVQLSMCSSMQVLQNTIIRFSPSPLIM